MTRIVPREFVVQPTKFFFFRCSSFFIPRSSFLILLSADNNNSFFFIPPCFFWCRSTSTNRELHDAAIEADVEETTFSHRRKKIDEIGRTILLAIFQRDVMKDEAVAIASMEESIMEMIV